MDKSIGTTEYVQNLYINRCLSRIRETEEMLKNEGNILDMTLIIDGKEIISKPCDSIEIFNYMQKELVPEYICTTHGQLGSAHIFLSKNNNKFKLIDSKEFEYLQDSIDDFCKIGKAIIYGN